MAFEQSRYQDPVTFKMTPAMLRARRPFFVKNIIGLGILLGVTAGVYTYTYNFLHTDGDFSDIPIPPIDANELENLKKEYEEHKLQQTKK